MEYVALLIISILGLALLVIAVVTVAANLNKFPSFKSNLEKQIISNKLTKEEKKELRNKYRQGKPNSIRQIKTVQKYEYPEATKRLNELSLKKKEEEDKNKTYRGKRGGRYTEDVTKDGRPYRRYF